MLGKATSRARATCRALAAWCVLVPRSALADEPATDDESALFAPGPTLDAAEQELDAPTERQPTKEPTQPAEAENMSDDASRLVLRGHYRSDVGLWTERPENRLAKLRQTLAASLEHRGKRTRLVLSGRVEYDPAYLYQRDDYDRATLETYELVLIGGESYVGATLGALELTAGRQIVAWGQGTMLSPLDVPNPRDGRELGLSELSDVRLAVLATRAALFLGAHRLEAMVVHESFFGLRPAPLSPLSPLRELLQASPQAAVLDQVTLRFRDEPRRFSLEAQQLFGRYVYQGHGLDLSLYGASLLYREGVLRAPTPAALAEDEIALVLEHPRYALFGAALAVPFRSLVFVAEGSYAHARPLNTGALDGRQPLDRTSANAISFMAGLRYAATSQLDITLECAQTQLLQNAHSPLLLPVEQPACGLHVAQRLLADRLTFEGLTLSFGGVNASGLLVRGSAAYALDDLSRVSAGVIAYFPGPELGPISGLDDTDRVFVAYQHDFLWQ